MLDVVVLDDSEQPRPRRAGLGQLRAVGGLYIPGDVVGELESAIHDIKRRRGFPVEPCSGELKWSPGKHLWMRGGLTGGARLEVQVEILGLLHQAGCEAVVSIHEGDTPREMVWASAFQLAHNMFIERERVGVVVADRPSDGSEKAFSLSCFASSRNVSPHPRTRGLSLLPSTVDSSYVELVQAADLVVGATLAAVAGQGEPAETVLSHIRNLMPSVTPEGPRGGGRVLVEPSDLCNLYHWLFGDDVTIVGHRFAALPRVDARYFVSPDVP